jgi:hypothetical protein
MKQSLRVYDVLKHVVADQDIMNGSRTRVLVHQLENVSELETRNQVRIELPNGRIGEVDAAYRPALRLQIGKHKALTKSDLKYRASARSGHVLYLCAWQLFVTKLLVRIVVAILAVPGRSGVVLIAVKGAEFVR